MTDEVKEGRGEREAKQVGAAGNGVNSSPYKMDLASSITFTESMILPEHSNAIRRR
jgi:hypothetical protein